jgi:hypothetical protein
VTEVLSVGRSEVDETLQANRAWRLNDEMPFFDSINSFGSVDSRPARRVVSVGKRINPCPPVHTVMTSAAVTCSLHTCTRTCCTMKTTASNSRVYSNEQIADEPRFEMHELG